MTVAVLADTGPLYALVDPSDQYHARSREQARHIERQRSTVLVAYPTLLECYTLVLRRLGGPVAGSWLREIRDSCGLINPTTLDYSEAFGLAAKYPDQGITLFDAVVAVLGGRVAAPVWSYDWHFDVLKVARWP